MDLINVGYGSVVNADKVLAVLNPDSAPIKRAVQEARDAGKLIDASYGRKTRAVLVLESGHLLLSGIQSETIAARAAANITEEAGK
ncbi:MAG: DUF370 domain-containing protein [Firmicutes bacterium]|nr:DUF370 domain-containing protein [Bacillota bacterium]MBQ5960891.1 DUF370 domain-containing protein [Bacillota bacterium]